MPKIQDNHQKFALHLLILLVSIAMGTILRFTNLTAKPLWIDEFATLIFSLGNSFNNVPVNQIISVDTLLQPLKPNPANGIGDVLNKLLTEDTHPPLYFILAHLWIKLFPSQLGLVSLFAERSFSAVLGVISIPCTYILAWVAFRSPLVGQLAAAMMAISPFGIALAQEARHYTLAILWVIASLVCLVLAINKMWQHQRLSWLLILTWITVNSLGMSTHYFFIFTPIAIALTMIWLIYLIWKENLTNSPTSTKSNIIKSVFNTLPLHFWTRIFMVFGGTLAGILVWLPIIYQNREYGQLSGWLKITDGLLSYINPLFHVFGTWIPMISLLPVEAPQKEVAIISGIMMLIFLIWAIPILWRGLQFYQDELSTTKITKTFIGVVVVVNFCFFLVVYLFAMDLTRAPRYGFVYFPAVMVLLGASLAFCWTNNVQINKVSISSKKAVVIILIMGFLSSITVVNNLAYKKSYRPNDLLNIIVENSISPPLVTTIHYNLTQTGEMMGIAWQFKFSKVFNDGKIKPYFLLIHSKDDHIISNINRLQNTVQSLQKPLDLWLINFEEKGSWNNCVIDNKSLPHINGYRYKHYHCSL
ncbi:MAG: glycosyltransferase [Cuspidothrix sp.]